MPTGIARVSAGVEATFKAQGLFGCAEQDYYTISIEADEVAPVAHGIEFAAHNGGICRQQCTEIQAEVFALVIALLVFAPGAGSAHIGHFVPLCEGYLLLEVVIAGLDSFLEGISIHLIQRDILEYSQPWQGGSGYTNIYVEA